MTLILFLATFVSGSVLVLWGNSYRLQGKRFPSRYGDTTSPWHVMGCGGAMIALSLVILAYGV